jgi:uncharacterized repeat protein (TIGR01451 family)
MKTYEKLRERPMALMLMAAGLALLLVTVLSLSLSARAEPVLADPIVDKQVSAIQAGPGDVLTYTIYVENTEFISINAWVTDTLPPEVDYVSGSLEWIGAGTSGYADGVVTWICAPCMAGAKALITFTAQISPELGSVIVVNTAEFTGSGKLITSTVSTGVSPGALDVLKTIDSPSFHPGDEVAYTIYISNTGLGTVDAFSMSDSLPLELVNVGTPSISGGTGTSCGESGGTVTCTGSLDPLDMTTVNFSAEVNPALEVETYFTNTVIVTGAGFPISDSVAARVSTDFVQRFPIIYYKYPPMPDLNSIPTPDPDDWSYVVSWESGAWATLVDHYVLQEATDSAFTQNVQEYETTETSLFIDKNGSYSDFYYYRVRADDGWGEGPWSNVESVSLPYYDDFEDSNSGWPDEEGDMYVDSGGDAHEWKRDYKSGQYRLLVEQGGPLAWFWQPGAFAPYVPPSNDYCIDTEVKFQEGNMWANMGVIIGAKENEGSTELYAMCLARDNDNGLGWFLMYKEDYKFPSGNDKKRCGCACPTGEKIDGFADYGGGVRDGTSRTGWNRLRIAVQGNHVGVYIGDHYKGERKLNDLKDHVYVGVIGGDYEMTPIDIRYEYFMVTPNSDCNY